MSNEDNVPERIWIDTADGRRVGHGAYDKPNSFGKSVEYARVHSPTGSMADACLTMPTDQNESVTAMCAHCKQSLFREIPSGQLMHVNGLRTCRKESGVYGAERVETAAANLLLNEECKAVTLRGDDYWAIPRDIYDELRAMLEDWPQ